MILESAEIKTDAFLELFSEYGALLPAIREHHVNNMGVSRFIKFQWIYANLIHKPLRNEELKALGNRFSDIVLAKVLAAPFVPGALELLKHLQGQCLCFVASGTPQDELRAIVHKRGLAQYFNQVCGTPRTKAEIVRDMSSAYSLDQTRTWFIGDAQADWEAAQQTGLHFIARKTDALQDFWNGLPDVMGVTDLKPLLDFDWKP